MFFPPKHVAHIISSPTMLKTSSHLEQGAGTYYSGTQAWNYRVCVSVSPPQSACVCVFAFAHRNRVGNYIGTNQMKTLFIWCFSLSYQSLTGYQRGWWIVFSIWDVGKKRGGRLPSPSLQCRTTVLWVGCSIPPVLKKKRIFTSSVMVSQSAHLAIHPHEQTSESLINFWIINLWPLFGKSWAYVESLFSHCIHSNAFLWSTEHSLQVSDILLL